MEPTIQVLVRFTKAPDGHIRLKEDMRQALIGVMLRAIPSPNCFIANTKDLLEAIMSQRPFNVYSYWKKVLENTPGKIFIGRSECEVINRFKLEIITPLPTTNLHKKVRRACIGLKIHLDTKDFDPQKNGFYTSLLTTLLRLKYHNPGAYDRHVKNQPAVRVVGTLFLPAHTYKVLSTMC